MTTTHHHPSCSARHGGLCTGCRPDRAPKATSDLCCPVCHETFWVTGDDPAKRARALEAWIGCCVSAPDVPDAPILLPGARIPTLLAALFVLTVAVVFVGAVVAGGVG
jgi:hypothetical protein